MKKAKVKNGKIQFVWPFTKTLNNGAQVVKELPRQYYEKNDQARPSCIIDVPDDVEPGWVWNGKEYAPRVTKVIPPPYSDIYDLIAEKIGMTYDDFWAEVKRRKRVRKGVVPEGN